MEATSSEPLFLNSSQNVLCMHACAPLTERLSERLYLGDYNASSLQSLLALFVARAVIYPPTRPWR